MTEAEDRFRKDYSDCYILLEFISSELSKFENMDEQINWGHVGTVGDAREKLKRVLMNLIGWDSEEESSRTVEEALKDVYFERDLK